MILLMPRLLLALAALVFGTGALAWILSGGLGSKLDLEGGRRRVEETSSSGMFDSVSATLADVARTALPWVLLALLVALALAMTAILARVKVRRERRYVRLRLMPYRADEAVPEEVRRLLESWHQQTLERWWRRPFRGQASIALEYITCPDDEGELGARLNVVCPEQLVDTIAGALRSCYPDSRLMPGDPMPRLERVIRLKKRFGFTRPVAAPEMYERSVADAIFNQMSNVERLGNADQPSAVQYVLTPVPGIFDRWARGRFSARERRNARAQARNPGHPGMHSELLAEELRGGLSVQHHTLFFVDVRIAAVTLVAARSVAGALRGSSVGVSRLVERYMRPWSRGPLYLERMRRGIANPIPGWHKCVLSSAELAGMWHLPSPGLTGLPVQRTSIPRAIAPPEISRNPLHAVAHDELGPVGVRPEDKSDGLGLIGGQKTGKTSVLIRTVQVDAQDDRCALIVLMPKPGDALKALSMVPEHRTVHFLDFGAAEFGINPLLADGEPAMVADKIVEAFRDINEEGDIKGSSDRFLRQAAQAAVGARQAGVLPGPPSLWDMYRMLLPNEVEFRERVVQALYPEARFADTVTFFGRDLPHDLREATVNTTSKLDAPRNKLLRLLVDSLDKVLRHPIQLSLDEVVRNREVLIVDGKMGTFGPDNCRVMMQFILNMLYGALQRQQQLPEEQRVRVALKVDEAHLIMNESFANALATLRSAGLEVVAAWQYGDQIQDPKIRSGLMSLLRQRCMFSMGEATDVREMSEIAMNVYVDMIRDDPQSRSRIRITPDAIYNMPNHHAVCSWISRGARQPAFIAQTMPLETDEPIIEHHLSEQRERGRYVPERLPDPLPEVALEGSMDSLEASIDIGVGGNGAGTPVDADEPAAPDVAPTVEIETVREPEPERAPERTETSAPAGPPPRDRAAAAPDSYTELDLDEVRGMSWDTLEVQPPADRPEPTPRELEILAALYRHQVLFGTQIRRRWWPGSTLRAAQQTLNRMARAGWVRRFRFQTPERGAQQRVYCITREGFELAQRHSGPKGPHLHPELEWQDPGVEDPRAVIRNLHTNGWILALQALAPRAVTYWRGSGTARLTPPRRRVRGQWEDWRPKDIVIGTSRRVHNLHVDRFERVHPAAAVELRVTGSDGQRRRFDLLVEMERGRLGPAQQEKLCQYDALITGWSRLVDRFKTLQTPPIVVFVCEDEPSALRLAQMADATVTGQIAKAGTDAVDWPAPGRRTMFFAAERDIHEGSFEALQLPPLPPDLRRGTQGSDANAIRRVPVVDLRLLGVQGR